VRWDLRGFGESDKPDGPYSTAMYCADLAALLDTLRLDRVHLAGISMGGVIAQHFALDRPERLLSLILVSTSSEISERATASWERLADKVESQGFNVRSSNASRSFSTAFAAAHPETVQAASERTAANDAKSYAAAARAVSRYNWTDRLENVEIPALILQGLEDRLTPPGGSVKMSRALPHNRLLMLGGVGHNLPLERPELFAAAVAAFTGGLEAKQQIDVAKKPVH
jgi:3-oxoadipate enol-lactonase